MARPTGDDESVLHTIQEGIAEEVGGEPEPYVHVTLQRFELPETIEEGQFLEKMEQVLRKCVSAEVVASTLFSTYHRYFQRHSVRWKVEATQALGRLTLQSAQFIMHHGGTSHWPNAQAPIAQFMTAVWTPGEVELPQKQLAGYPRRLMTAAAAEVTKIIGDHEFEILRSFILDG